jgi:hypothetical protein
MSGDGVDGSGITPYDRGGVSLATYPGVTTAAYGPMILEGPVSNTQWGIVLGRGDTPVALADIDLATRITHGVGANELDYGATVTLGVTDTGSAIRLTMQRQVTNLSGADITVKEIGLFVQAYVSAPRYSLIAREVIAGPVTIGHTEAYIFRVTIDIPYVPITEWFARLLFGLLLDSNQSVTDITNTVRPTGNLTGVGSGYFYPEGGVGNLALGMIAGSGVTPETKSDYVMETPIAHGTGAGELQYGACATGAMFVDAGRNCWYITRTVTNNSGGNVTINEIGLYIYAGNNTNYSFLVVRKKLAGGLVLADTESAILRVKVTM